MHIDNDKLVGTYVSDKYSEKGTVTIVLTDGDSTPTREYTRYKYVQTEQLTAIGVAVKDYGAILVPETTIELFTNGTLNAADFGVFVKFNDDYYSISLSSLLDKVIGAPIEFEENSFDDYPTVTFNATLPPYSVGNAEQVPTVDENGKVAWEDIPKELPAVTGNTGKFLGVNDGATGVEWKNVPNELPAIGDSDAGKVLKVNADHTGTEWGAIPNELPAIASGDAGKVLKVNAGETGVEWGAAGGSSETVKNVTLSTANVNSIVNGSGTNITISNSGISVSDLNNYSTGIVLHFSGTTAPSRGDVKAAGGSEPGTTNYTLDFNLKLTSKLIIDDEQMGSTTTEYRTENAYINGYAWRAVVNVDQYDSVILHLLH